MVEQLLSMCKSPKFNPVPQKAAAAVEKEEEEEEREGRGSSVSIFTDMGSRKGSSYISSIAYLHFVLV